MAKQEEQKETKEQGQQTQKKQEKFVVTEVPKNYEPMIVDAEEQQGYTILTALAKVMNDIEELKKTLL